MPRGPKGEKRPADVIGNAIKVARIATGNFCRIHKTLKVTPAMAAGVTSKLMGFEDIVALIDAAAPPVGRPKSYKKRAVNI